MKEKFLKDWHSDQKHQQKGPLSTVKPKAGQVDPALILAQQYDEAMRKLRISEQVSDKKYIHQHSENKPAFPLAPTQLAMPRPRPYYPLNGDSKSQPLPYYPRQTPNERQTAMYYPWYVEPKA